MVVGQAGGQEARRYSTLRRIRDLEDDGFDVLAAVLFDQCCRIVRAALIAINVVRRRSTYIDHDANERGDRERRVPPCRCAPDILAAARTLSDGQVLDQEALRRCLSINGTAIDQRF